MININLEIMKQVMEELSENPEAFITKAQNCFSDNLNLLLSAMVIKAIEDDRLHCTRHFIEGIIVAMMYSEYLKIDNQLNELESLFKLNDNRNETNEKR